MSSRANNTDFDIIIVGGGLIGASLALSLSANRLFRIALLEPKSLSAFDTQKFDLRVTALNNFSVSLLEGIGVWDSIAKMRSAVFREVGVWEEGVDPLSFRAEEIGETQLGYMVENTVILNALSHQISKDSCIEHKQAQAREIRTEKAQAHVTLEDGEVLSARLVIGADGPSSLVRRSMGTGGLSIEHSQKAMVMHVQTPYNQSDVTWQRFTPTGAQAFLPMAGNNASLVWYNTPEYTDYLMSLSMPSLNKLLLHSYPERLGEVDIKNCGCFPLVSHHATHYVKGSALLIGDAAHSVHPLAGLGANLGMRDISALTQAIASQKNFGIAELEQYERSRREQNLLAICALEMIYMTFGNVSPIPFFLRRLSLRGGKIESVKRLLMRIAVGSFPNTPNTPNN